MDKVIMPKATSLERLADIIDNLEDDFYSKGFAFDDLSLGDFIAAELLKVFEVREKE